MSTYAQVNESNARVLHALLFPFRLIRGISLGVGFILICILFLTYNNLGWVVGVGINGYFERTGAMAWGPDGGDPRPNNQQFEVGTRTVDVAAGNPLEYDIDDLSGSDDNLWSRSMTSFRRRSARFELAMANAGTTVGDIRTAIAALKHIDEDAVKIPPIPKLVINYGYIPYAGDQASVHGVGIRGMCIVGECTEPDYTPTFYSDVFSEVPYIPAVQQRAIDALNAVQSDEFWMAAFRLNHVGGDVNRKLYWAQRDYAQNMFTADLLDRNKSVNFDGFWDYLGMDYVPHILANF